MRRLIVAGGLALATLLTTVTEASAWARFRFGFGFHVGWERDCNWALSIRLSCRPHCHGGAHDFGWHDGSAGHGYWGHYSGVAYQGAAQGTESTPTAAPGQAYGRGAWQTTSYNPYYSTYPLADPSAYGSRSVPTYWGR